MQTLNGAMDIIKSKKLAVCLTIDNNFAQHAGVTLCSLLENNNPDNLDVYLITLSVSQGNKKKLSEICKRHAVNFSIIETGKLQGIDKFKISLHASFANYIRIFLPEILSGLDSVLYLDSDTVVLETVYDLRNVNINGSALAAAVIDKNSIEGDRLGIPKGLYFNSGVMLINLSYWREHSLTKKLSEYIIVNQNKIVYWDQDALNALLYNKYVPLDQIWNYTNYKQIAESSIKIIHYTGIHKPWNYYCDHPMKVEYFKYLKLTPWKKFEVHKETFINSLHQKIKRFLQKLR